MYKGSWIITQCWCGHEKHVVAFVGTDYFLKKKSINWEGNTEEILEKKKNTNNGDFSDKLQRMEV